jgi:hypothetical protein
MPSWPAKPQFPVTIPTIPRPALHCNMQQWRRQARLSRILAGVERILAGAGFDPAPWLAVAFGAGAAAWLGLVALCLALALAALVLLRAEG